jgi:hypothetical protein
MQIFPERKVIRREADPISLPSRIIQSLHAYWHEKRVGGYLPSRSAIDPVDIRHLLPHVILGTIEHNPLRILFRLAGTRIVEFRGEITGHYVDTIPWNEPATRAAVQQVYGMVVETRAPTFAEIEIRNIQDSPHRIFTGLWPLASDPLGPVDTFIAAEDYGDALRADFA